MLDKMAEVESRYDELEELLADPKLPEDRKEYTRVAKERSDLVEVVTCYREWRKLEQEARDNRELLDDGDPEIEELATEELAALKEKQDALEQHLRILLLPKDPNDGKNVLLEIRAGTGGEEASLFSADLYRMYSRYAETRGWKVEVLRLQSHRPGRVQGDHRAHRGAGGLQPAQVRGGRTSGSTGSGDRDLGPHPYVGRDRRGASGG